MRISSFVRTATLAFALIAVSGLTTGAFANTGNSQAQQQAGTPGPYDGADFSLPANNIQP